VASANDKQTVQSISTCSLRQPSHVLLYTIAVDNKTCDGCLKLQVEID